MSHVKPLLVVSTVFAASLAMGQDRAPAGDPAALRRGGELFRERCAECHGADAKGVVGHDLTRLWASGTTDDRVFQTIRAGVPNTIMPSSNAPEADVRTIVAYLRGLSPSGGVNLAARGDGNAENGARIFWASCGGCHTISGRGGQLGPELTRVSLDRAALTLAIRQPSNSMPAGYQAVTLVTRDGQRIKGNRKGEDAFSIQIMDARGQLQGYLKSGLREVVSETTSLMPAFGPDKVSDGDLADLLQFMSTLQTAPRGGRRGGAQ
jgi:putative heme-binding domain-containing protein